MKTLEQVKEYSMMKMINMIEKEILDAIMLENDSVFILNKYLNKEVMKELESAKYNILEKREDGIILSLKQ